MEARTNAAAHILPWSAPNLLPILALDGCESRFPINRSVVVDGVLVLKQIVGLQLLSSSCDFRRIAGYLSCLPWAVLSEVDVRLWCVQSVVPIVSNKRAAVRMGKQN
jgi:hypothetical protein